MSRTRVLWCVPLVLSCALAMLACGGNEKAEQTPVERGEMVYMNVCVACHNADPNEDGSLGPAIAGSSLELITARVLRAEYPPGYTPKRGSNSMPALPYLEPNLPDIKAFLDSKLRK